MEILIICARAGMREPINLDALERAAGTDSATFGHLHRYLSQKSPTLRALSSGVSLAFHYVDGDGGLISVRNGAKIKDYARFSTFQLLELKAPSPAPTAPARRPSVTSTATGRSSPRPVSGSAPRTAVSAQPVSRSSAAQRSGIGPIGILLSVIIAAAGPWLAKIAGLMVYDSQISTHAASGEEVSVVTFWWVFVLMPVVGIMVLPGLNAGLRALFPALRRAGGVRKLIAVAALLLAVYIGVLVLPPAFMPGDVLFEQGPPAGTVVAEDDFSRSQPPWSTRLSSNVGVFMKSGAYHIRVKSDPGSSIEEPDSLTWGSGALRPNSRWRPVPPDVRVDVTARRVTGENFMYGIACRYQDSTRFYNAVLRSDGRFRIAKHLDGRVVTLAEGVAGSTSIDFAGPNRIQLACTGGWGGKPVQTVLWVNDQRLVQATDRGVPVLSGATLTSGSVGFSATSDQDFAEVAFDDVIVIAL